MNYLLDTHTFLWFISDAPELSDLAKTRIETANGAIYLNIASLWEIAIKASLGKLELPTPFAAVMRAQLSINSVTLLPISLDHLDLVATLPFHHRDPFDRLIASQALHEELPLIGRDTIFDTYGVARVW